MRTIPGFLWFGFGWAALCFGDPAHAQTFTRVTDAENPIVSDPGHPASHYKGASWVDLDSDGRMDLVVDQGTLYRNLGDGAFERVDGTGLGDGQVSSGFSMSGVSFGDFDNDGDPDAYIGSERSLIYRQGPGVTFEAITSGDVGDGLANRGWTVAWGDYTNDGYLDAVIVHPAGFIPGGPPLPNHQYVNDGPPDFTFTRVTTGPIVTGLDSYTVGTWSDYDNDGDLDFFIGSGPANGTTQADNLYRNLLTETGSADFERITDAPIATDLQDGQVWNWIDYDNDGDLDAYVTNWGGSVGGLPNRLYRQDSGGTFTAIVAGAIVTDADVSLASVWADYDNDGDLDCFVGNDGASTDRYYRNDGGDTFTSLATTALTDDALAHRGAAAADYDNDGDVDLFVNGGGANRRLFRNDTPADNHWLNVRVIGVASNRSGIGAKVRVKATIGGTPTWQLREISGQNSFNGHSSQRAHFGLGAATTVDSLRVEWPSGAVDVLTDMAVDDFLTVIEGGVVSVEGGDAAVAPGFRAVVAPNPLRSDTTIRFDLGDASEVSVSIHDVNGRLVRSLMSAAQPTPGIQAVVWDGRDDQDRAVPSGVYVVRVVSSAGTTTGRMTLVR